MLHILVGASLLTDASDTAGRPGYWFASGILAGAGDTEFLDHWLVTVILDCWNTGRCLGYWSVPGAWDTGWCLGYWLVLGVLAGASIAGRCLEYWLGTGILVGARDTVSASGWFFGYVTRRVFHAPMMNFQDGVAIVEEINTYNGVGGRGGGPFAGDELFAVGGEIASHLSYTAVVDRIRSSARPIALTFR